MIKTFIYITTQKEFIHQYKDAPEEVSYLRFPHRHLAHIKVKIEVFHDDREVEFILFKHEIENSLNLESFTDNSCEMIAKMLLQLVQYNYGFHRDIEITVSEDGENGCELIYRKDGAFQ